jgi:acyl-CoA reductase-like NAD-dependent aldehyde dehydrogenase
MSQATAPITHTDRFYIGGQWVPPSSDATISVIDSDTEQVYFTVPEAQAADISRAVGAAREAFDSGPWPWLTHEQRAEYLRAIGAELKKRTEDVGQIWPRESGVLHAIARAVAASARNGPSARSPHSPARIRSRSRPSRRWGSSACSSASRSASWAPSSRGTPR